MTWRSTTFRIAAFVFLFQIVTAVALLIGLGVILRAQSAANATEAAETIRNDLLATYAQGGATALAKAIEFRKPHAITRGVVLLLADPAGRSVAGNLGDWPPSIAITGRYVELDLHRVGHATSEAVLVRPTRLPDGNRLLTGVVVEGDRQLLGLLERASLLVLALALVFAAVAAWLAARLIVRRLDTTIDTLGAVRAGTLDQRVPPDPSGDAFATLGSEVNQTLDRVETLIGELKIATDGLAHDLKSPLTRLRFALEQAADEVRDTAAQEAVERALAEGERLLALVETALAISRAEAGIGSEHFVATDLSELLRTTAEIYEPLVEDHGRRIVVEAPPALTWPVHRQLLDQAIGNLIDNALNYGTGTVTLSLAAMPEGVEIAVADQGGGIAEADRGEALRRFGRLDAARGGSGAGLGLSLVQAVAHLHGGVVALRDAQPGLFVAITLHRKR